MGREFEKTFQKRRLRIGKKPTKKQKTNKHQKQMKGCWASLVVRKIQIKSLLRCNLTPMGLDKVKNTDCTKRWSGATETFIPYW